MNTDDKNRFEQIKAIRTWEILPMYYCGPCGMNARVSPTDGKTWGCPGCGKCTDDLMQFERIKPLTPVEVAAIALEAKEVMHDLESPGPASGSYCYVYAPPAGDTEKPPIDIAVALRKLEEIVCTRGCDAGVVLMTDHGTTHPEVVNGRTIQVYDHEYFSPLGDALIELYKLLGGVVEE